MLSRRWVECDRLSFVDVHICQGIRKDMPKLRYRTPITERGIDELSETINYYDRINDTI